ncbi:hypothetical protein [Coraliomargarita parva]|uniref:hypothetical protein n=1 Tax=Coraliomargarita parva TaxID=3014050 RepID=UPI0022B4A14B|nr:hypothetical protein [Coraliomargarita parva]
MRLSLTFLILAFLFSQSIASERAAFFTADVVDYTRGELTFDGKWTDSGKGSLDGEGWFEFDVEIEQSDWYTLSFENLPSLMYEVFLDGERIILGLRNSDKSAAETLSLPQEKLTTNGWTDVAHLPLTKGVHTIRYQRVGRMGYPAGLPRRMALKAASGPESSVSVKVLGYKELRLGDPFELELTGGAGEARSYDLVRFDELNRTDAVVASVHFPKSTSFITRKVSIPTDSEGVFQLAVRSEEHLISIDVFAGLRYFVVDTELAKMQTEPAVKRLLYVVDCVENTINGEAVTLGENYWEANGSTRLVTTEAGTYRESNNGTGPDVDPHPRFVQENFSGFAYLFDVEDPGSRYLIEIDHPDDDWRSVCISIVDVYNKAKGDGFLPPTAGYETGGPVTLSNQMLTESVFFYPNGKELHVGLMSARLGKRAAASKIRIYKIEGGLRPESGGANGRLVGSYMEEPERWHRHFNTPEDLSPILRDYIGLQRNMEWIGYSGMNAFWPTITAYQQATYPSEELVGFMQYDYNIPRLSALLCDKYGLGYIGEIFTAKQRYFTDKVMAEGAENPDDLYTASWWGYRYNKTESRGGILPVWNVLHPHVQDKVIAIYAEMAQTLGDTRSFAGLAGRLNSWKWSGLFALSSLNWGYGDWTISQFSDDTGIAVPGAVDDPKRFEKRYRFLTSPEMKEHWIAWRQERVTDFLARLRDAVQAAKPEAAFFLVGDARTDQAHLPSVPANLQQRVALQGLDLERLDSEPGLAFMPDSGYGRGKSMTLLQDQAQYDDFMDADYIGAGHGAFRSYSEFGYYQEWAKEFPLDKLGMPLKRWWYTSGSDVAGRNQLERYATVLAEQDTMVFRDGGYPITWGEREYFNEWMAEFRRLPRVPFERVEFADDPVAFWTLETDDAFIFYAVNRERYPVQTTVELQNTKQITQLGTGGVFKLQDGNVRLEFKPFQLRAFRASKKASIEAVQYSVPKEAIGFLRYRLSFAQKLNAQMQSSTYAGLVEPKAQSMFQKKLNEAWNCFSAEDYWRARSLLVSATMMQVYQQFGRYPEGQIRGQFINRLENLGTDRFSPSEPFLSVEDLNSMLVDPDKAELQASESFNPEWKFQKVLVTKHTGFELDLDVPVDGFYRLSLGYIGQEASVAIASLDGKSLKIPLHIDQPGEPQRVDFAAVSLKSGKARLILEGAAPFGLYAAKLAPDLVSVPTTQWSTVGPFKSIWNTNLRGKSSDEALKSVAMKKFPPELNPDLDATYTNELGDALSWQQTGEVVGSYEESGVNFAQRAGITGYWVGFAQTFIESPRDQDVILHVGSDWWANVYLNGEIVLPMAGHEKLYANTGFGFNGWKPRAAKIHLNKGQNRLMVKNHGGSMNCWFTVFMTDPGGLRFAPTPNELSN